MAGRKARKSLKSRIRRQAVLDARNGFVPDQLPAFNVEDSSFFDDPNAWDPDWLDIPRIKHIMFGPRFPIRDEQLLRIAARPALATSLIAVFILDASHLTDEAVVVLVRRCPFLRFLAFESAALLTDTALLAACEECRELQHLTFTGHPVSKGNITAASIGHLSNLRSLAPHLSQLDLRDQGHPESDPFHKEIRILSFRRVQLAIRLGDTVGSPSPASTSTGTTTEPHTFTLLAGTEMRWKRAMGLYANYFAVAKSEPDN